MALSHIIPSSAPPLYRHVTHCYVMDHVRLVVCCRAAASPRNITASIDYYGEMVMAIQHTRASEIIGYKNVVIARYGRRSATSVCYQHSAAYIERRDITRRLVSVEDTR